MQVVFLQHFEGGCVSVGLIDILWMPQTVNVAGRVEQQGLANLGSQAASGAREESLRLTAEKTLSILARCRYGFF
jgi:hypothetical protein